MGLGVDRVVWDLMFPCIVAHVLTCILKLQFKIVTPDGKFRTVNKCQNTDLFFALRGGMSLTHTIQLYLTSRTGGGGTFGVVLESTILASPQVTLQAVLLFFSPNTTLTNQLWTILVDNGIQWANETWGGLANAQTAVYVTPKLSKDEAAQSMAPLIEFGQGLLDTGAAGAQLVVTTFPSYYSFFQAFASSEVAVSRLPEASIILCDNH